MHITAHHRVKPKTALVAGDYVAYNGGVGRYKTIGAKLGRNTFYGKNNRHNEQEYFKEKSGITPIFVVKIKAKL